MASNYGEEQKIQIFNMFRNSNRAKNYSKRVLVYKKYRSRDLGIPTYKKEIKQMTGKDEPKLLVMFYTTAKSFAGLWVEIPIRQTLEHPSN